MRHSTLLSLTAIAGFIDTVTFMSVGGLFAAHVTGNFVVFGASLASSPTEHDYLKLIAFPVFVIAVMLGAALFGATRSKKFGGLALLLMLQALMFAAVAACAYYIPDKVPLAYLALALVAAMGLQNSLHRYVAGPMTTVMTGTVMNWSAAKAEQLFKLPAPEVKTPAAKPMGKPTAKPMTGWMIVAFAFGCACAGFVTHALGLAASAIPAVLLLVLSLSEMSQQSEPAK